MHQEPCQPVVIVGIEHSSTINISLFAFIHQISKFVMNALCGATKDILFSIIS